MWSANAVIDDATDDAADDATDNNPDDATDDAPDNATDDATVGGWRRKILGSPESWHRGFPSQ